ncbi:MaoC/PaaZ C-terminal domain-containing protein [Streptosporangium sandarakinum]|uniref:MaoC/PaaZ C-terminal domain-containing protein n=1 Tax=Streptosporangium sandarakinum TaxID=1260955 RepID=UPI0033ACC37F
MMTRPTTPKATRPDGLWLDDLAVGQAFASAEHEVTEQAIIAFASEFDPQPYHLDPDAAEGTFFDGLVASGWHTAAITMRLLTQALPLAAGLIGAQGEMTWPSATVPGDRLRLEGIIDQITPSASRPGRASVFVTYQTVNQRHQTRYRTTMRLLAWADPDRK